MANRTFIKGINDNHSSPLIDVKMLAAQATEHEQHRLESVSEFLTLVGLLTLHRAIDGNETVDVRKALLQFGSGMAGHGTQAAHCLPGQALLNERVFHPREEWTPGYLQRHGIKPIQLTSKLRNLSGRTDIVDSAVNKVDSSMERMANGRGLVSLYRDSLRQVVSNLANKRSVSTKTLGEYIRESFECYREGELQACRTQLDTFAKKSAPTEDGSQADKRAFRLIVAESYLEVLGNRGFIPDAITAPGFGRILRDVILGENQGNDVAIENIFLKHEGVELS